MPSLMAWLRSDVPLALLPARYRQYPGQGIEPALGYRARRRIYQSTESLRSIALGMVSNMTAAAAFKNRYFLSVAGAGPDGAMVHAVDQKLKSRAGMLACWLEGVRQHALYKFPQFRVNRRAAGTLAIHLSCRGPHQALWRSAAHHHASRFVPDVDFRADGLRDAQPHALSGIHSPGLRGPHALGAQSAFSQGHQPSGAGPVGVAAFGCRLTGSPRGGCRPNFESCPTP